MKNSLFLLLAQLSNFLLPLLAFPLLIKTVSTTDFGEFIVAFGFISYALIIFEYSFSIIVPRFVNEVCLVKTAFYVVAYRFTFFLFFLVVICFFKNADFFNVLIVLIPFLFSQVLIPISVFMASKMIREYTLFSFISKLILLCTVILLFFSEDLSIYSYTFTLSSVSVLTSLYLIRIFIIKNNVFNVLAKSGVSFYDFYLFIKSGWTPFLSSIISSGYNASNVFYISFYYGYTYVALYGLAERYVRAGISLLSSFSLSGYNEKTSFSYNFKVVGVVSLFFVFLILTFYNFSLLWELLGFNFTYFDFRILFFSVPVALVAYFIQLHAFYLDGRDKDVVKISVFIFLFHVATSNAFGYFGFLELSLSMLLICEFFTLFLYVFILKLRGNN